MKQQNNCWIYSNKNIPKSTLLEHREEVVDLQWGILRKICAVHSILDHALSKPELNWISWQLMFSIFTPGSERFWSDQLGNSRIWGATQLSESFHKITLTPKLVLKMCSDWWLSWSWNLKSQTWTTAEVRHTFTPFVNNSSGEIFRFLSQNCAMSNLYTSKNSSAWWKVSRLVAMPSKLKPSSWSTFITGQLLFHHIHSYIYYKIL